MNKDKNTSPVNQRLDRSIHGTPRLKPDEQRKYLGTFRERVSLAIKIKDLQSKHAFSGFQKDLNHYPKYLLIINGNVPQKLTIPYLGYANQHNIDFTIKTDSFYWARKQDYGIIYASHHHAINQFPINVMTKYSDSSTYRSHRQSKITKSKPSLWSRFKKLF